MFCTKFNAKSYDINDACAEIFAREAEICEHLWSRHLQLSSLKILESYGLENCFRWEHLIHKRYYIYIRTMILIPEYLCDAMNSTNLWIHPQPAQQPKEGKSVASTFQSETQDINFYLIYICAGWRQFWKRRPTTTEMNSAQFRTHLSVKSTSRPMTTINCWIGTWIILLEWCMTN